MTNSHFIAKTYRSLCLVFVFFCTAYYTLCVWILCVHPSSNHSYISCLLCVLVRNILVFEVFVCDDLSPLAGIKINY